MESPETVSPDDERWMARALELAGAAAACDEVPVGAVLVQSGRVLGEGHNQPRGAHDPTAHAEIVALREAAAACGNYRLPGSTLYVTIEPCTMCVGAMMHARVATLVFGAREPRAGAVVSQQRLTEAEYFNHRLRYIEGVLAEESGRMLTAFFKARRS